MVISLTENGAEDISRSKCRKTIKICQNVQNNILYAMSEADFEFRTGNILFKKKRFFSILPPETQFLEKLVRSLHTS